jgi:hypothetical protein
VPWLATAGVSIIAPLVPTAAAASPNARFIDLAFMTRSPLLSVSLMCGGPHTVASRSPRRRPRPLLPGGRMGTIVPDLHLSARCPANHMVKQHSGVMLVICSNWQNTERNGSEAAKLTGQRAALKAPAAGNHAIIVAHGGRGRGQRTVLHRLRRLDRHLLWPGRLAACPRRRRPRRPEPGNCTTPAMRPLRAWCIPPGWALSPAQDRAIGEAPADAITCRAGRGCAGCGHGPAGVCEGHVGMIPGARP